MHVVWHQFYTPHITSHLSPPPSSTLACSRYTDVEVEMESSSSEIPSIIQSMNIQNPQPVAGSHTSPQPAANTRPIPTIPYIWRQKHPRAQLFYIRDHKAANKALERLDGNVYGFDLEWKPTFVKGQPENPVALVQIANHAVILLLQITAMQEFPSKLYEFLLNPNIVKAGVGIQRDAKKLYQDWQADIRNCADLALLARTADNGRWKGRYNDPLGLAHLTAVYENRALAKGKITRSNWEYFLTEPQQMYAANDAHAGYVIYARLMDMIPSVSPPPEVKCYSFDAIKGHLYEPFGALWRPSNPNYDPGPPPPPRQPKPPRQPRPNDANLNMPNVSVAPGADNALPLPVPQSTLIPRNVRNNRGKGGFRGNYPRPPHHGGNQSWHFGTANHPEARSFQPGYRHGTGEEEMRHSSSVVATQPRDESSREINHS